MAYCRWSCMNHWSDIYCYEDVSGGFTIHVAGNRVVGDVPPEADLRTAPIEEFMKAHRAQMAFLETAQRVPIGLPHDGAHFNEPDEEATIARLLELRAIGYHVPEYAVEALREDAQSDQPSLAQE